MIFDTSITLQAPTDTINAERVKTTSFATYRSNVSASVQPAQFSEADRKDYGLRGGEKKVYLYVDPVINETYRMVHAGKTYEIRGVNHWRIHTVFLAVPKAGTN